MVATLIVIIAGVFAWWIMFGKYYPVTKAEIAWLVALIFLGICVGIAVGIFSAKKAWSLPTALIGAFLLSVAPALLGIPWQYYSADLTHTEFSLIEAVAATLLFICPGVSLISGMTSIVCCAFSYLIFKGGSPSPNKTQEAEQVGAGDAEEAV